MAEDEWISSLQRFKDNYAKAVKDATKAYAIRVISAFRLSEDLGRRATGAWGLSIDSESVNEVTEAIAGAYMSGKTRANQTLPRPMPPSVIGFRPDDMQAINNLRDFNSEEIRKFGNELRIVMKLRGLERQSITKTIRAIREDLEKSDYKVERIAATEVMRAANEGRINEYKYRGVKEVRWVAGEGSCDRCQQRNGKLSFIMVLPPLPCHPECRCSVIATR